MTNEELVGLIQQGIDQEHNMEHLYIQNKGFIATVIKRFRYVYQSGHDSLPIIEKEELMHEAYFGLIEAVKRYDPDQGANFLTYASLWINQVVKHFLDNSGRIIRIPIHTQEKIYKYNQARAYFLSNYNREPDKWEYASWIAISPARVEKLEQFMFQGAVRSLDEVIPGNDNESLSLGDTVSAEVDVEGDAVERLAAVQFRGELWDIVSQVLKDERMIKVIQYRFVESSTLDSAGSRMGITREMVRQYEAKALKQLRCNSRTRRLGQELGLWSGECPIDAHRVKCWAEEGKLTYLNKRELKYAVNMGWVDSGIM